MASGSAHGMPSAQVSLRPTTAPGVVELTGLQHLPAEEQGAARVLSALVDRAFAEGAHRVEAEIPAARTHLTTRRALQRAGLRPEGVARGRGLPEEGEGDGIPDAAPQDLLRLARLRDDPAPGDPAAFIAMLNATLPRKRVIVQGLVGDGQGRILLCELTYKQHWDLPGGVADPGESPVTSLEREVREELGLELAVGELLAVDWLPPYRQWEDAVLLVFDLGEHPDLLDDARLQRSELRAAHWVPPGQAHRHVAPYVDRLLGSLLPRLGGTVFLEDGLPRPGCAVRPAPRSWQDAAMTSDLPGTTGAIDLWHLETGRLRTAVRLAGEPDAPVLLLLHGNVSSSAFFEHLMAELCGDLRLIAPDFRGYGDSDRAAIDATRGVADLSDDTAAVLDALGVEGPVDVLGWSAGGNVALQLAIDHPERVRRVVLEAAGSPFGFGGSSGLDGRPVADDFAGSGGGTANPQFCQALAAGDRGEEPTSPLTTLRAFYVRPGFTFDPEDEQRYLDAMLRTSVGEDVYPGDLTTSENWPGVAPGRTGMNNALSPKYLDQSGFADLDPAPPVLWVRGDQDQIVSDTSMFDLAHLGRLGAVPGYPGEDVCPTQPMVSQLRSVLERAGALTELVYEDTGHSPHLEQPERFAQDVRDFLGAPAAGTGEGTGAGRHP